MRRVAIRLVAAALFLGAVGLAFMKWKYGTGPAYPDLTAASGEVPFETVVQLEFPPGNVAVDRSGRIFFDYIPFAKASRFSPATVFELVGGVPVPFPDAETQARFQSPFGMTIDSQQRLWIVEQAAMDHERTRVLAFDIETRKLVFDHWFAPGEAKFAQDLRVSPDGATVYLADTGLLRFRAAELIVLDVATKTHRSLLKTEAAAQPQDWTMHTKLGPHMFAFGLVAFSVGLDGIALSNDGAWLYFGAMTHDTLHRVPTAALLVPSLSSEALHGRIEKVGRKPMSDGIAMDREGNVLITDIEHGAIVRMGPDGGLKTVAKSPDVVWADGIAVEPDGSLLLTDSAIPVYVDQMNRPPSFEVLKNSRPYKILRAKH